MLLCRREYSPLSGAYYSSPFVLYFGSFSLGFQPCTVYVFVRRGETVYNNCATHAPTRDVALDGTLIICWIFSVYVVHVLFLLMAPLDYCVVVSMNTCTSLLVYNSAIIIAVSCLRHSVESSCYHGVAPCQGCFSKR